MDSIGNNLREYIKNNIHHAIEAGEIEVYYQPIIHSMSMNISSLEALARWNSKELGMITPAAFIPVLEEEGLITALDLHMVELVLKQFKERQGIGLNLIPVSVNISQVDFETKDMPKEICALVDQYKVDHKYLIVEITESACTGDPARLKEIIDNFHKDGFHVWMDDFGSGYSSLNFLQKFDFDLIKLDMRFLDNFDFSGRGAIVLKHLIQMAEDLFIDTLVEGVETKNHLIFLKTSGALYLQGYLFSKPAPQDNVFAMAKEGQKDIINDKVCDFYTYITRETKSLDELPPHLKARMKRLPEAVLEEQDGLLMYLKVNTEYTEYLVQKGIIDPSIDYDVNMSNWRIPMPEAMREAVLISQRENRWVEFDDFGNCGYIYVIAIDEVRKITCFRILFTPNN